ncbi:hypothetical protein SAMN05444365_102283 [Micromonospora pattaloongensis]|uniref:Uncharacterized protein n=1 Tax=Micromonospora pattaloongensis TaxID=405436 RepID=A0A1H3JYW3_9ACTN|nr:hypothetical protein [Micromonospora pattaloongensis]SDY44518.1 hypothetical protein SAMN05444365_102283 [Micromonospora pattaloongensis]
MRTRRLARRPIRRTCLDLAHTDPDQTCPYCTPDTQAAAILDAALAQHAEIAAEDAETWGWAA